MNTVDQLFPVAYYIFAPAPKSCYVCSDMTRECTVIGRDPNICVDSSGLPTCL